MRIKIFLVILLCMLQQTYGSKSTKNKGRNRLIKWAKKCLIAVAVNYASNEIVNDVKPQVADSISLVCKYNVPDQNAGVMMKFVMCAKDQEFEKYLFDNSENCSKIKDLYNQAKSDGNCALNTPKIIHNRALARFRGEQLSKAVNVQMLKEYLTSYPIKDGECFKSKESVSDFIRKSIVFPKTNFDFFQFTSLLEVTKIAYPDDPHRAVQMALKSEYKDFNVDNAKQLLELIKTFPNDTKKADLMVSKSKNANLENVMKVLEETKLYFPNDIGAAFMKVLLSEYKDANVENAKNLLELTKLAFPNEKGAAALMESKYKNANVENAKKLFKLTKLAFPDDTGAAILMTLQSKYKDVNVENAKKLLQLTKFAYPDDTYETVAMAMQSKYKDVNVEHAKRLLELTKLFYPNNARYAVMMALRSDYKDVNVEHVKKLLELTKLAYPNDIRQALSYALDSDYKDINADNAKKLLGLTKLAYPNDTFGAVMAILREYRDVNAEHTRRMLELTKAVYPNNTKKAVTMALRCAKGFLIWTKHAHPDIGVTVSKVNERYKELQNSWLWYLSSEESIMREALKVTHLEVVKSNEDL